MGIFKKEPMTKKEAQRAARRGGTMSARDARRMADAHRQPDSPFKQAKAKARAAERKRK